MSTPAEDLGPLLRLSWPVMALVLLLALVGADLVEDAFGVAQNYTWSSAALIPLIEIVTLNLALVGVAALTGWLLPLRHRRRWHGSVELVALYTFAVAGWLLFERFVRLFISF